MKTFSKLVGIALGLAALPALAETIDCKSTAAIGSAGRTDAGVGSVDTYFLNPAGHVYKTQYNPLQPTLGAVYLNGTATSEPSALGDAAYVRGTNRALWEVSSSGVWTSLGGDITWNPAAVEIPNSGGNRMVFYRGTNQETWYRERVSGVWGPHTSLGGVATSSPQAVSWGPGHAAVFKRGQANEIWYRERNGGVWSGWTLLGGSSYVDPVVVSHGTGTYAVFTRSGSFTIHVNKFSAGAWSGWTNLGGPPAGVNSEPAAAPLQAGFVVFVLGNTETVDNNQFRRIYKRLSLDGGGSWGAWEPIMVQYNTSTSNPEAFGHGGNTYIVAAPTTNNQGHGYLNLCFGTAP